MATANSSVLEDFQSLKTSLKTASIQLIEQDRFGQSRELTEIMESLAELERRTIAAMGTPVEKAPTVQPTRTRKDRYPRFYRNGDLLFKEGMKQDGKSIYTQKVDREGFLQVTEAVRTQGKAKFRPADLMENLSLPSYQVYLVLKVLQDAGIMRSPERGHYQLSTKPEKVDAGMIWTGIAQQLAH